VRQFPFISNIIHWISVVFVCNTSAQNLIQDTVVVSFAKLEDINSIAVVIDTIIDARAGKTNCIGRYEINKYLIVPVDLLILTEGPLSENLKNVFSYSDSNVTSKFKAVIDKFWLSKNTNSLFNPHYCLNASIHLHRIDGNNQSAYLGQLLYESTQREKLWKEDLKHGFNSVVEIWQKQFTQDLITLLNDSLFSSNKPFHNLRPGMNNVKWINFYGGLDYILGTADQLFDGEIFFSHREANTKFFRSGYALRYRMSKKFESIEFGNSVDYLLFRLSRNLIFRLKSQLFIGVNRWKDYESSEHNILDMFIGDFSLSQSLILNPLDTSFILLGCGLSQDLSYIYSQGFNVQWGFLFHLGLKI
jgi:hypothetical protein